MSHPGFIDLGNGLRVSKAALAAFLRRFVAAMRG